MKKLAMAFSLWSSLIVLMPPVYSENKAQSMNLHPDHVGYRELIDFLYDFAAAHRFNVFWFGWYKSDSAQKWIERSDEPSNFKIKLELLTEQNGSIFVYSHFDESIARLSIDDGQSKPEWIAILEEFHQLLLTGQWHIEALP